MPIVQEAIWLEKKLNIEYRREEGVVERIVEPLGLVAKSSIWYLIAAVEEDLRTYRISRLTAASILDETFQRPEPFDLALYWEQSTKQFKAKLPRYPARVKFREKLLSRIGQLSEACAY